MKRPFRLYACPHCAANVRKIYTIRDLDQDHTPSGAFFRACRTCFLPRALNVFRELKGTYAECPTCTTPIPYDQLNLTKRGTVQCFVCRGKGKRLIAEVARLVQSTPPVEPGRIQLRTGSKRPVEGRTNRDRELYLKAPPERD